MGISHIEYDRDVNPYPSSGKKYNGEKAIISLTSWKGRINTVVNTLYSLYTQCPGFHIVLVLSEEEFPKKENELPTNLMLFVENDIIELLWVYHNYKSFKKVLFTMDKYRDVPVISADDDCIYICNYAQKLYDEWVKHPHCVITNNGNYKHNVIKVSRGPNTLFHYSLFSNVLANLNKIHFTILNDDAFYSAVYILNQIKLIDLCNTPFYVFHTDRGALSDRIRYSLKDTLFYLKQIEGM